MCAVFSAAAFGLVGSNLSWGLAFPGLPASHLELESRRYMYRHSFLKNVNQLLIQLQQVIEKLVDIFQQLQKNYR